MDSEQRSWVANSEYIRVLDDNVIHVDGVELGEVSRERDEIDGRLLVELQEVGVSTRVLLPSEAPQDSLKRRVR